MVVTNPQRRPARRSPAGTTVALALAGALVAGPGCAHRSQLHDPVAAGPAIATATRAVSTAHPPPAEREAQVALEFAREVFVAFGYFGARPPDTFHAELVTPFGVTLIEVQRADGVDTVRSGSPQLQRLIRVGGFARVLALWLDGSCADGDVWEADNGVAIDCEAPAPDDGLRWRIWLDPAALADPDGFVGDPRRRGELLRGNRLLADFTCTPNGRCVVQDPVHGYALRIVPAP